VCNKRGAHTYFRQATSLTLEIGSRGLQLSPQKKYNMKQQVENLIDRLADKTLSFGCYVQMPWQKATPVLYVIEDKVFINPKGYVLKSLIHKTLGHPTTIGRVLEIIENRVIRESERKKMREGILNIMNFWGLCGFAKSLQQIVEDSGWEKIYTSGVEGSAVRHFEYQLKDENAHKLFTYLLEIL
jgi:hypothetical protein